MKLTISCSRGNAQVGIWWYTDEGEVWALSCPTADGVPDGLCVQYSDYQNHMNTWRRVVKSHAGNSADGIIAKGYKSIERGRVIYDCRTTCYTVTCSDALYRNQEFRRAIVDAFELSGNQVEFIPLHHYFKEELTGDPELDKFYYNSEF